jgi:hypothetical protein
MPGAELLEDFNLGQSREQFDLVDRSGRWQKSTRFYRLA